MYMTSSRDLAYKMSHTDYLINGYNKCYTLAGLA